MVDAEQQGRTEVAFAWYAAEAAMLAERDAAVPAEALLGWLQPFLPQEPGLILDVGAGTGREAAWLAAQGHQVLAIEPVAALRRAAEPRQAGLRVRWLEDRLPALAATQRLGLAADLVLLSAVWQHVAPADRPRAFRELVGLLKAGGLLALTLRHGPAEPERGMHPVSVAEIEALARAEGLAILSVTEAADRLGRPEIRWTQMVLRLPDDGSGALPLLRHLILNDAKSATYKLGLLRSLCRVADGAAGLAEEAGPEHVAVPLGLVALLWLRLYLPLLAAGLPQSPQNRGAAGLGFVGPGCQALLAGAATPAELLPDWPNGGRTSPILPSRVMLHCARSPVARGDPIACGG
ncbi:hypothetical protein CR165_23760 [Pseudoroseomonas aestuarii]|uniref:Methyltransferase type 11 domain-containing protein n=1 Tax=Teichococcus aestuarii TaxID=568898 RepID=A0A2U1UXD0_9PROT|nr:hypothetical protein CR165_23760 [Pseudoroseomonas aestuarii]